MHNEIIALFHTNNNARRRRDCEYDWVVFITIISSGSRPSPATVTESRTVQPSARKDLSARRFREWPAAVDGVSIFGLISLLLVESSSVRHIVIIIEWSLLIHPSAHWTQPHRGTETERRSAAVLLVHPNDRALEYCNFWMMKLNFVFTMRIGLNEPPPTLGWNQRMEHWASQPVSTSCNNLHNSKHLFIAPLLQIHLKLPKKLRIPFPMVRFWRNFSLGSLYSYRS